MTVLEIAKINDMPVTTGEGWTLDQLEILEREAFERDMDTEEMVDMEGYGPSGHYADENMYDSMEDFMHKFMDCMHEDLKKIGPYTGPFLAEEE